MQFFASFFVTEITYLGPMPTNTYLNSCIRRIYVQDLAGVHYVFYRPIDTFRITLENNFLFLLAEILS